MAEPTLYLVHWRISHDQQGFRRVWAASTAEAIEHVARDVLGTSEANRIVERGLYLFHAEPDHAAERAVQLLGRVLEIYRRTSEQCGGGQDCQGDEHRKMNCPRCGGSHPLRDCGIAAALSTAPDSK